MKQWVIIAVLLLLFSGSVLYIRGLNNTVRLDERINASWAEIDSQLKRRNDLIPSLVSIVKRYAVHEKDIFTNIAAARSQLSGAQTAEEKIAAAGKMDGFMGRLLVIVENYPDLKADQTFMRLMDELSGTENRIAVARKRYNSDVREFNTYIREVIGGYFAKRRGLDKARPYYEVPEIEKAKPEVKF